MYCNGNCYGLVCKSCNTDSGGRKTITSVPSPIYLSPAGQIMANQGTFDRNGHLRPIPSPSSPFIHPGFKFSAGFQRVCFGGLDTSPYLPSPLTSPALMALASSAAVAAAAAAAHDNSSAGQFNNDKDDNGHISAATSHGPLTSFQSTVRSQLAHIGQMNEQGGINFSNNPMASLLPAHHSPPFASPDSQNSRTPSTSSGTTDFSPVGSGNGGAFKPLKDNDHVNNRLSVDHIVNGGYQSSAFLPPNKCPKLEPLSGDHQITGGHHHLGAPDFEKLTDRSATPVSTDGSESGNRSTPEEGRRLRGKKRSSIDGQSPCCPVCGVTVRPNELLHHFAVEVDRLQNLSKTVLRRSNSRNDNPHSRSVHSPVGLNRRRSRDSPSTSSADKCSSAASRWDTYLRVRANRNNRLGIKACKNKRGRMNDETGCPVCGEKLPGNPDEMNVHVELCLRKQRGNGLAEDDNIDIEGTDNKFEEYEWAGQTRIRATSLLEGGFSASGMITVTKPKEEDEDIDLNVDGDDSTTYGNPQYTEADIIPCSVDEPNEKKQCDALRDALLCGDYAKHSVSECSKWTSKEDSGEDNSNKTESHAGLANSDLSIVDSLKSKIKELDDSSKVVDKLKCLICMEQYTNPLVSVSCWHVHCEECWLRTLGVKKLCPQCNMITSPSDLRRVFL